MPTLSTSQTVDSTHLGKRILLRVTADDTLGTVFLPDAITAGYTNGDYIRFYVDNLGFGSQIDFGATGVTSVNSPARLYRVGQYGTAYFTGTEWQVEISPALEEGPPIIKPAPLNIWTLTGTPGPIEFGQADDHNLHFRSAADAPVTVSVLADSAWLGTAEYWMDGFAPDVGPMPDGGSAIFGCHSAAGGITFVPDPGVTINTPTTLKLTKLHAKATLTKVGPNEWDLAGDLDLT